MLESELRVRQQQITELESHSSALQQVEPEKEEVIRAKKVQVEERSVKRYNYESLPHLEV